MCPYTPLVVLVAVSAERAYELARTIVAEQLAGCMNILPGVQSVYRWQGEITKASEIIVLPFDRALPEFQAWPREALETDS